MQLTNDFISPLIAHRGASALAPENTLAAFRKAHEIGAQWVEFDVMLSHCGEAVVIHDETLDRTTNGRGYVREFRYDYLQTLDAGSWFDPIFAAEKIPTLAEVLQVLQHYQLKANIEIKPSLGQELPTVKKVLDVIAEYWKMDVPPLISSFSYTVLKLVRQHSPAALLGYLMHEWQTDWNRLSYDLNCSTINVNYKILNQERVKEIKSTGRLLLAYTVDDPVLTSQLFAWGVDGVFSNCPPDMEFCSLTVRQGSKTI